MPKLAELNVLDREEFARVVGPVFEQSSWIAHRGWNARPFWSADDLHEKLCGVVRDATAAEKLSLVCAHPDLADRTELTPASQQEQQSAGLGDLSAEEQTTFHERNREYREHFGFPFVLCARMNNKAEMLDAFAARLQHSPETELETALAEIFKIAKLRLMDLIE